MTRRPPDDRDDDLGAALSRLPVPDHGPAFWADLDRRIQGEPTVQTTESGELHLPPVTQSGPELPRPSDTTEAVSLDERRARRAERRSGRRFPRGLTSAAAAVALVVAAAGAVAVVTQDGSSDKQVRTADRPATGPTNPAPGVPAAPAEFSATYTFTEGTQDTIWSFSLARDGSYRWTAEDGSEDSALDMSNGVGRSVFVYGPNSTSPNWSVNTNVPPGWGATPGPLHDMGAYVVSLARAGDPRITTSTVAGRAAWHFDGPTVQDRNGGNDAPDHRVADVDQAGGVLLTLTESSNGRIVRRLTATEVTVSDQIDRARYRLEPPAGARKSEFSSGFAARSLDQAAAEVPYDLLVPGFVPDGFTLDWSPGAVTVNRDVATPTGVEGSNAPTKPVTAMTWRLGAQKFTVELRPSNNLPDWGDPFGAEGMVADAQPVRIELPGRPALEGTVVVDGPLIPHLWGISGDVVVTVSGDLSRDELQQVAASLRPRQR
jgi:hypothetical protein